MNEPKKDAPKTISAAREGAPAWVVPLYVGGLILVYIGERVLSTFDAGHWVATAPGIAAVLVATATRFVPTWQAGGERGRIEKLLGILSIGGLVALSVYAASTDWGMGKLGLLTAADAKRENVHAILTIIWTVLICVSVVPMLFAEAALYPQRNADRLESRRVRAAAAAGLTLALAAVYGALFVYSATGSEAKVDFSYFKTSEPSESTKKLVAGLNQPIRVIGFFPEVSPVRYEVEGYLKKLAAGVPNLKVEIEDRYLDPKLAKEMKIVQDGVIVIVKGDAKRTVTVGTDMKDAAKNLKTLDKDFQERLYKLLRERRNVYLTVGHGEINDDEDRSADKQDSGRSAQILRTLLGKQNYTVKNLGLSQGLATDVPDDADVLMILGPTEPFSPEELAAVQRYAKRGGKLLMALDPEAFSAEDVESESAAASPTGAPTRPASLSKTSPASSAEKGIEVGEKAKAKTPPAGSAAPATGEPAKGALGSLEALAATVGLQFTPVVLANDKQFARRHFNDSDRTILVTNRFSSHASVSTLSRNSSRAAIVVAGAGSLQRAPGSPAKVDIAVRAMSNTFDDLNRNYQYDEGSEKRDTFGIAAAVSEPVAPGTPPPGVEDKKDKKDDKKGEKKDIPAVAPPNEMRAFVLSDSDVFTDLVMSNFMANQLLIVDALRWLGGEESFAGEVNTEEDVRIEHTQHKDLVWFYATIFGAPALVLGLGLTYSRRARQRRGGKK
ncbi:MAG TPA: Gldg family protein [Polyangiaceae bacterium]|nr:Gldg family protein [Polyangiaceae bacterium]